VRCPLIANKGLWGATYPAGQSIRFTSIKSRASAGAGEVVISPSGTAWQWFDSPGAALGANDLDLDATGTYEEIHMDLRGTSATGTEGPIVFAVKFEYVRPTISGVLTEPNSGETFDPLHDEEFVGGMPVAADLARILGQNAEHLRNRVSTVLNWSAVDGSEADALRRQGMGGFIPLHPGGAVGDRPRPRHPQRQRDRVRLHRPLLAPAGAAGVQRHRARLDRGPVRLRTQEAPATASSGSTSRAGPSRGRPPRSTCSP